MKRFLTNILASLLLLVVIVSSVAGVVNIFSKKAEPSIPEKTLTATVLPQNQQSLESKKYKLSPLKLNNRLVYIYGEITGDNGPQIAQELLKMGSSSEPINILINSPGGSVIAGSTIVAAIEAARGPVNTICVEFCASMAAMIHQYGTNRLVLNKSILMFHPASGGGGSGEIDKMHAELTFFKRFMGKMEENAAVRSKNTYKEYKYRSGTEMWLDSEDSLTEGFADKIVSVSGNDATKLIHNSAPTEEAGKKVIFFKPKFKRFDIMWE